MYLKTLAQNVQNSKQNHCPLRTRHSVRLCRGAENTGREFKEVNVAEPRKKERPKKCETEQGPLLYQTFEIESLLRARKTNPATVKIMLKSVYFTCTT